MVSHCTQNCLTITHTQAFSPRASQAGPNVFGNAFTDGGSNSSSKAASGNLAGPALLGALNAANRSNSGYLSAGGAGMDDLLSNPNAMNNNTTGALSNGGANVNSAGGAGAPPGSGGSATSLVDALFYAASGNLTPRTSVGSAAAFGDMLSPTPTQSRTNSLALPSSLAPRVSQWMEVMQLLLLGYTICVCCLSKLACEGGKTAVCFKSYLLC